jgi:ElaB/YqjD/DUF883 family membrane-anchored ribosome-binding protein
MDQTRDHIDQDIKTIIATRVAISEKLGALRGELRDKVEEMKMTSSQVARDTSGLAKELIGRTARAIDPIRRIEQQPWVALAGVVVVGLMVGMVQRQFRGSGVYPYYPPKAHGVPVMPSSSNKKKDIESGVYPYFPQRRTRFPLPNVWHGVSHEVQKEVRRSQAVIGRALQDVSRDMIRLIVPMVLRLLDRKSH